MRFGIKLGNLKNLPLEDGVGRLARLAEELGFDSVWVADHVVFPHSHALDGEHANALELAGSQHADPFLCLAYLAGQTTRVKLGTSVIPLPIRNPLVLAKMLATLDVLSKGRVILGAGVGWLESEFEALHAPDYSQRGAVTDEWIQIMRNCWTEALPSFHGRHYEHPPLHFSPKPAQSLPIWVGGNSPPALRRAGRLGNGWLGSRVATREIPGAIAQIRSAAEEAGRDPAMLTFALGVEIDILDKGQERSSAGLLAPERGLLGTVDQVIDHIGHIGAAGIQLLELRFRTLRDRSITSISPTLEMTQRFAEDIMPHFVSDASGR